MENVTWSSDVQAIGEQVASLNLLQMVQLGNYLEQVHGVKPASSQIVAPEQQPEKEQAPPPQSEFAVSLDGFHPDKKLALIKLVREIISLGLKEAKEFVEGGPKVIKEALSKADAEVLKAKLEQAGGKVSLK
jgi:large subunit ribosomal protein L7/L12